MIAVAYGHTHKSTKLAYTKIHVYNEVAWFHLLQFFHCQSHFARTCRVALKIILMETVEYLVVGKEAQSQVVIGKSLVNGMVYWSEIDVVGNRKRFRIGRRYAVYIAHLL